MASKEDTTQREHRPQPLATNQKLPSPSPTHDKSQLTAVVTAPDIVAASLDPAAFLIVVSLTCERHDHRHQQRWHGHLRAVAIAFVIDMFVVDAFILPT